MDRQNGRKIDKTSTDFVEQGPPLMVIAVAFLFSVLLIFVRNYGVFNRQATCYNVTKSADQDILMKFGEQPDFNFGNNSFCFLGPQRRYDDQFRLHALQWGINESLDLSACSVWFDRGQQTDFNPANISQNVRMLNRIPGFLSILFHKVQLVTELRDVEQIPDAFKLPEDLELLKEYQKDRPGAKFLKKSDDHHGVELIDVDRVLESALKLHSDTFLQSFVPSALLFSGRRFDVEVYGLVTSTLPLRVYLFQKEIGLYFCPREFQASNLSSPEMYIVSKHWDQTQIPFYKELLHETRSMKGVLEAYLGQQLGLDPQILWDSIENALNNILLHLEVKNSLNCTSTHQQWKGYEVFHADFIVNTDLSVFLLEFERFTHASHPDYGPVMGELLSMMGVTNETRSDKYRLARTNYTKDCLSKTCQNSCSHQGCLICPSCSHLEDPDVVLNTILEKQNQVHFKRIFPEPVSKSSPASVNGTSRPVITASSRRFQEWLQKMCILNQDWCDY